MCSVIKLLFLVDYIGQFFRYGISENTLSFVNGFYGRDNTFKVLFNNIAFGTDGDSPYYILIIIIGCKIKDSGITMLSKYLTSGIKT